MLRYILLSVLFLIVARLLWRLVDAVREAARLPADRSESKPAVKLVRDPICGTFVAPGAALSLTAAGGTHYFCSEECRAKFSRQ